jgi:hypothetical protein
MDLGYAGIKVLPWLCKITLFTSGSVEIMMGVPNMCVLNTFPYLFQRVIREKKKKKKGVAFITSHSLDSSKVNGQVHWEPENLRIIGSAHCLHTLIRPMPPRGLVTAEEQAFSFFYFSVLLCSQIFF